MRFGKGRNAIEMRIEDLSPCTPGVQAAFGGGQAGRAKDKSISSTLDKLRAGSVSGNAFSSSSSSASSSDRKGKQQQQQQQAGGGDSDGSRAGVALQTSANTVDIRGCRADEGISKVDNAVLAQHTNSVLFVVHGVGTGKLRQAVLEFLRDHPQVEYLETEKESSGGCTMVYLR